MSKTEVRSKRASDFVPDTPAKSVLASALGEIPEILADAWVENQAITNQHFPHSRVAHTSFAQTLVHLVMNSVYERLYGKWPGVDVELVPNKIKSAYHLTISSFGVVVTISTVQYACCEPRFAHHRKRYAQNQGLFDVTASNSLEISQLSDGAPAGQYFQILHGPKSNDRRSLGFVCIVPVDERCERLAEPQDLIEFLNDFQHFPSTTPMPDPPKVPVEDISPKINIELRPQPEMQQGV